MARILILGANGMVGHIARIYLSERKHEVISVARSNSPDWIALDVEDADALLFFTAKIKPDIVFNCIGVLIKESEENPIRSIRLNALLPRLLSAAARDYGFKLIHISSDCVFSGANGPYRETDRRDADEIYGRTKALGEVINDSDLTIRTSIVGPALNIDGSGLFNWFMKQKGIIRGFTKAFWSGVTTLEMAKVVEYVIEHPVSGLVHLSNTIPISKFELLSLFAEIWGKKDIRIERDDTKIIDRSFICTRKDFTYPVPSYRAMLEDLREFMVAHPDLYHHYM